MLADFILNGQGHGEVGQRLAACRMDPGLMRPYYNEDGESCLNVNTGRTRFNPETGHNEPIFEEYVGNEIANLGLPIANATLLRKDEWQMMDQVVLKAARQRLRAWGDLAAANTLGGFNGMSKTILEHETMSDPGEAIVDMDGITEGRADEPLFQREALPLPITHSSFWFSSRQLAVSRNLGESLDVSMAEVAGRRVAEQVEKTTIGVISGAEYGDGSGIYSRSSGGTTIPKVFGYKNFPDRVTKINMTVPTGSNGTDVYTSWLALRELMTANRFYGPFMAYVSTDYDQYLDNLFSTTEPSAGTLRENLLKIDSISGIRRLDFLTDTFTVLFVQLTADVARAVNGMDLTTIQWETKGGLQINFKVMAIMVPQLRADFNGRCGIGHGTTT